MANFFKRLFGTSSQDYLISWSIDTDQEYNSSLQFVKEGKIGVMRVERGLADFTEIRNIIRRLPKNIFENRENFKYVAIGYDLFMENCELHGIDTGAKALESKLKKELKKLKVNRQILIFDVSTGESQTIYI